MYRLNQTESSIFIEFGDFNAFDGSPFSGYLQKRYVIIIKISGRNQYHFVLKRINPAIRGTVAYIFKMYIFMYICTYTCMMQYQISYSFQSFS
jgi:hypothetical protein